MSSILTISVVVPVYSGKKYLAQLVEKIEELKDSLEQKSDNQIKFNECIFVCDEPIDDSLAELKEIKKDNDWINILELSRNFGQHAATIAGILHTSGQWIITLDEDLQHDPKFVPDLLLQALESHSDVLYAAPKSKVHQSFFRDFSSSFAKRMLYWITGNAHIKKFNSYRVIRGSIARAFSGLATSRSYFDIGLCWYTERINSLEIEMTDERYIENKTSGYTPKKLLRHLKNLIISSNTKVYNLFILLGFLSVIVAFCLLIYIFINAFTGNEDFAVRGWPSLMVTNLFFFGIITTVVGVTFQFISIILQNIQGKPTFYNVNRDDDETHAGYLKDL